MLSFLEDIELFGREGVGLVVGDGVVGGGGDDDVVGEVDVEESGGFVALWSFLVYSMSRSVGSTEPSTLLLTRMIPVALSSRAWRRMILTSSMAS